MSEFRRAIEGLFEERDKDKAAAKSIISTHPDWSVRQMARELIRSRGGRNRLERLNLSDAERLIRWHWCYSLYGGHPDVTVQEVVRKTGIPETLVREILAPIEIGPGGKRTRRTLREDPSSKSNRFKRGN
jgi:hypothetical protein